MQPRTPPLRRPPLARPHHAHLGPHRHGHALRPHTHAVLHRPLLPRHGGGRLLPRGHLLPHAVVPTGTACPRHQPFLYLSPAQRSPHGSHRRRTAQSQRPRPPRRLAVALPRRRGPAPSPRRLAPSPTRP